MPDTDVLVIGSGFGGSISAARLTAAGLRVTVIERGPWRDTVPVRSMGIEERAPLPYGRRFASHLLRTVRSSWFPAAGLTLNKRGLFEVYLGKGLNVVCTSGVGGGSHAYGGLNVPPTVEGTGTAIRTRSRTRSWSRITRASSSRWPRGRRAKPMASPTPRRS